MENKRYYELTDETIEFDGHVLHRIICTKKFQGISKGAYGGFIEGYENLRGEAWVGDKAKVYDGAFVGGQAFVLDNACVSHYACISDRAVVRDNASISGEGVFIGGNVVICDSTTIRQANTHPIVIKGIAKIKGDAVIESDRDYIVFKNWWSSGRSFTWTRSNDMWSVGCFYGTGKELVSKAYKDSEVSGREYERVVKYVESIKKADKPTISKRLKKLFFTIYDLCIN